MFTSWSRVIVSGAATAMLFAAVGVSAQYNPRALQELAGGAALAEPEDAFAAQWPLQVPGTTGAITIYQPQMEELAGDMLSARAAVSIVPGGGGEPVYGVVWFKSRIATDRVSRVVQVLDVNITQTRIPEGDAATEQAVREAINRGMTSAQAKLPFDQLIAMLETKQPEQAALKFDAPRIVFMNRPAIKVQYDGEPKPLKVPNSPLERVANTPFFVVRDPASGTFYLKGGGVWYDAPDAIGPFRRSSRVPQEIITLADQSGYKDPQEPLPAEKLERLEIIAATEPTELIWTDGSPQMAAVPGTGLLYVTNTDSNVFVDVQTQRTYVLLSGRWFEAANRSGPWTFVPPGNLPSDFAKIPAESERGEVLVHIAGTPQAKQAVADAQVPQTAAVNRKQFEQPKIQYDGDPFFEPVEGTSLSYAANSPQSVVRVGDMYYACTDAVWYESASPNGPWELCTEVPAEVNDIPASSPIYPVRYVQVYDYTDDYVYTGYAPGYLGTYAYDGAIVYGTGYYYRPWWGYDSYYPRAYTYGFGARYDCDSYGWGFGFGYGWGGGSIWLGYNSGYWGGCDPWFGYGGYYPYYSYGHRYYPYRHDYHDYDHDRYSDYGHNEQRARNNRDDDRNRRANAFGNERNASANRESARSANVYDRRSDVRREASSRTLDGGRSPGQPPRADPEGRRNLRNDVLADREGRVFRRTGEGDWQVRDNGSWRSEGRAPTALANEPAARQVAREASRPTAREASRESSRPADVRSQNPGTPRVRQDVRVSTPGREDQNRTGRSTPVQREPVVSRTAPGGSQSGTLQRNTTPPAARENRSTRISPSNPEPRSARAQGLENPTRRSPGQPPLAAPSVTREPRSTSSDRTNAGGQGSNRFGRTVTPIPEPRSAREAPAPRANARTQSRAQSIERSSPPPPVVRERSSPPPAARERSSPPVVREQARAPRASERAAPQPSMERSSRPSAPPSARPGGSSRAESAPRSSSGSGRSAPAPGRGGGGGGRDR